MCFRAGDSPRDQQQAAAAASTAGGGAGRGRRGPGAGRGWLPDERGGGARRRRRERGRDDGRRVEPRAGVRGRERVVPAHRTHLNTCTHTPPPPRTSDSVSPSTLPLLVMSSPPRGKSRGHVLGAHTRRHDAGHARRLSGSASGSPDIKGNNGAACKCGNTLL